MGVTVNNCKRCNKIFHQIRQPYCSDCGKIEEEKFSKLYRFLQNHGPIGSILIEELAEKMQMPVEEIERYFIEGSLGTAAIFLQIHCQACGMICNANQRLGRYCVSCSEQTATKAKVGVKSLREIEKNNAENEWREKQAAMLKQNQDKRSAYSKFGNIVKQH